MNSPTVFASEKKKYLDSVINILEKKIKFERFRNPYLDRTDNQKLISEMEKITQKISQENTIPFAALNEIFKDNEMVNQLFSLLRFGNNNTDYEAEYIPIGKHKEEKKIVIKLQQICLVTYADD